MTVSQSVRDRIFSFLAWPLKRLVKSVIGEERYQQTRRTLLKQERGLGLDWQWGNSLRSVHPIRRDFGWQAGQSIHRYYTEEVFLPRHAKDIRGYVLEMGDSRYTRRFGGSRVLRSEVLHAEPGNEAATIVADLTREDQFPCAVFDCVVCTFTLQFVYDIRGAIRTLHRILKPGGVLLITMPGISQIARYDDDHWGDYWRVTSRCLRLLLGEVFPADRVSVEAHGNVLTALAGLHGIISRELRPEELRHTDRDYEVTVTARAVK